MSALLNMHVFTHCSFGKVGLILLQPTTLPLNIITAMFAFCYALLPRPVVPNMGVLTTTRGRQRFTGGSQSLLKPHPALQNYAVETTRELMQQWPRKQ